MATDLHSHFIPLEAANSADVGIRLERSGVADVRYSAPGQTMTLPARLVDLDIQRADMRRQRLDRRMLAIPPFCFQYELPAADGIRWTRSLNDGVAATAASDPASFIGFGTLPLQDVPAALDELERVAGELRLPGIEIGSNINGVELDSGALEPFWERVAAHNLIVLIHPHYIAGADRLGNYYLRNLIGNPMDTAIAGARLLLGGVLERHRNLRIILSHGGGALPGILGRILHGHRVRPESHAQAHDPAQMARRLFYDTIVFEPRTLRYLVETFGASQVILGTDYPFDMGEEQPVDFIEQSGLSEDDAQTILSNGERLLDY